MQVLSFYFIKFFTLEKKHDEYYTLRLYFSLSVFYLIKTYQRILGRGSVVPERLTGSTVLERLTNISVGHFCRSPGAQLVPVGEIHGEPSISIKSRIDMLLAFK
jgi:hypothetical protein